jgi:hypothetical protein
MSIGLLLLILALVCFVVAALPRVSVGGVNLVPLGLALFIAYLLLARV